MPVVAALGITVIFVFLLRLLFFYLYFCTVLYIFTTHNGEMLFSMNRTLFIIACGSLWITGSHAGNTAGIVYTHDQLMADGKAAEQGLNGG